MNLFKLISFFLYISAGTVIAQQLTTVSPKTYTSFEIDVAAAPSIDGISLILYGNLKNGLLILLK